MIEASAPPPGSTGRLLGAGFFGGALAGAAAGVIDGLWSLGAASQFLAGAGAKLRFLLFLAASHALAGALLAAAAAALLLYFVQLTRLGDLVRHAARAHREARARDPREALAGLSLVLAGVPLSAAVLGATYLLAYRDLLHRKHLGLIIAVAMGAAIAALLVAVLLSLAAARPLEKGLARLAARPRLGRALSSPLAPAVSAGLLFLVAGATVAVYARETLALLPLRPYVAALLALLLLPPSLRIGVRAQARLSLRPRPARIGIPVLGSLLLLVAVFTSGEAASVRKAAHAYTGLGEPLIRTYRTLTDLDRDGYSRFLGGGDCNDWDPTIHPGAPEIPDDGIDNNCVGGDAKSDRPLEEVAFAPVPSSIPDDLNVLFVTIDTLRHDHVGAYGYERPTTPNLDRLAAEGALFENAWAHAPSTRYSIPAILTGRYPLQVDYDHSIQGWPGLSKKNTTIAEVLRQRGFATAAILNYWYFDPHRGLDQGFDHYDNENRRLHKSVPGEGPAETQGSSSKEQTDKAIEYLETKGDRRFFLWVHYYDPHYRYERHPGMPDFGDRDIDLYDQEIRFTDHHIGRLLEDIERRGLWDRTAVVVTGDHGEGFGEHGVNLHGYHLYAAQTRVPLIIRVPGLEPLRIAMPASHVDILPTLANLAGASPTREMQGRSLLDVISGQADPDQDRWVFQQLSFENQNEYRGAASKRCHVIYNISPNTSWELYQIDVDPGETRDIIDDPGPCAGAREALEVWTNQSEIPLGAAEALLEARPEISRPTDVVFGDEGVLLEVVLPEAPVRRGESFEVTYTFEARGAFDGDWRVFSHFEEEGGGRFLGDHQPVRPLLWWRPGQFIRYGAQVTVPRGVPAGTYRLYVGLFRGDERKPARSERVPVAEDRALVGTVKVR